MLRLAKLAIPLAALLAVPLLAQDGGGEIIVTAQRRSEKLPSAMSSLPYLNRRPVIGLTRQADSVVRQIEITSDSRDPAMRQREVQTMLLAAIDKAAGQGLTLVTGEYEVVEVTRSSWRDQFPGLSDKVAAETDDEDDDDYYYYDDDEEDDRTKPVFEDTGSVAKARLMVKVPITGSIVDAQKKISSFVRSVPANGRSQIEQTGALALTIIKPEQYRDQIYRLVADGAKRAVGFYGDDYHVEVSGLDREIAWAQVSNTEVFLYIPYAFTIRK